ncbi:hypothetical protein D5078_20315 [Pectobacterium carotovorum]|nr:hypothetical protein D5078_20315 [Pectobacterium carotovorum]
MSGRLEASDIVKITGSGPALPESQGAFLCWNRINGQGRTEFVNHRGSGSGGFRFWNGNHEELSELASLDSSGTLYTSGGIVEAGRRVYSPNNKPTPEDIGAYSKDEGDARYLRKSGGILSGEVISTAGNALRLTTGDYAVMLRNDGGSFYLLLTNKGDINGNWNTLRPFRIDISNGNVELAHNVSVGGNLTEKGQRIYSPNNKPTAKEINAIAVDELSGIPLPFPGAVAPSGWLKCNGQPFDKTLYPVLASRYPSGVLPDLRGEFVRGWDDGRGVDTGRALLSAQGNTIQSHAHEYRDRYYIEGNGLNVAYSENAPLNYNSNVGSQGTDSDNRTWLYYDSLTSKAGNTETRPRNIAFNYIVRAA